MENTNRMAEVAKMFGKELGERFDVVICGDRFTVYFTETGMEHEADVKEFNWYNLNPHLLEGILTGRAVIVNEAQSDK